MAKGKQEGQRASGMGAGSKFSKVQEHVLVSGVFSVLMGQDLGWKRQIKAEVGGEGENWSP